MYFYAEIQLSANWKALFIKTDEKLYRSDLLPTILRPFYLTPWKTTKLEFKVFIELFYNLQTRLNAFLANYWLLLMRSEKLHVKYLSIFHNISNIEIFDVKLSIKVSNLSTNLSLSVRPISTMLIPWRFVTNCPLNPHKLPRFPPISLKILTCEWLPTTLPSGGHLEHFVHHLKTT